MKKSLERKLNKLRKKIRSLDSAMVAFSGGVDSSLVMRICREELGENAVAVTTLSSDYPKSELSLARRVAKIIGVKHITYDPSDDSDDEPHHNQTYSSIKSLAMRMKVKNVVDGSHKDDKSEKGASYVAAKKAGIKSPLLESDLTKAEIRMLSKELGLPNWDRKSSSARKSAKLSKAKKFLESLGAKKTAIRARGKKIYIIPHKSELAKLMKQMEKIKKKMNSLGFSQVLIELS
jgi:uncharacterized protein